jgi:DNA repair protein RadC
LFESNLGDPSPSQDDILLTDRLKEAGEVLGINVIDHVILGVYELCKFEGERADLNCSFFEAKS